jgi:hypothetical protein
MNAWSLLYDVMNDLDFISANGGFEYTPVSREPSKDYLDAIYPNIPDDTQEPIVLNEFKLNMNNQNGFWKYEEDLTLKEIQDYLGGTYRAHYTSQESKTQTLDLIESIGDAEAFCRSNAIKYLSRFGKKNGKSKLDILKAIHYCVLLYHFAGLHKPSSDNYETF